MVERLPALNVLIVNAQSGIPGHGFVARPDDELETAFDEVFQFDWSNVPNPFDYARDGTTETALVDAILLGTESRRKEIYSRVKVRGVLQRIFRLALMRAYDGQCAFCGLSFEEALEAAHIVPWTEATHLQRLDPANGLLLCANHHRLFDCGWMTLGISGTIHYSDPHAQDGPYTASDQTSSVALHGEKAWLPSKPEHRPSVESLRHHHSAHAWEGPML
ncbi:HNH endonuclease signature motif containing protein [Methylosinus sp. sav-2]|uniref:HNH endonuclease n=1 Tax=Methylosinus sp. sav-2 TaxID=2485168 RepID=UPI0014170A9F|nr:HNH endonuclease signature motif containing protein [Methylosinus sp. sav-2]